MMTLARSEYLKSRQRQIESCWLWRAMDSDELYVLRSRVFVGDKDGALSESQSVMIGTPELRAATSTYTTLADGIIPSPPTGASESLVAALAGLTALSEYDYQKCLQV